MKNKWLSKIKDVEIFFRLYIGFSTKTKIFYASASISKVLTFFKVVGRPKKNLFLFCQSF